MRNPDGLGLQEFVVELRIEGREDLNVHPWHGPAPIKPGVAEIGTPANGEFFHVTIVNDEDVTVRPWRGSGRGNGNITKH